MKIEPPFLVFGANRGSTAIDSMEKIDTMDGFSLKKGL
jgi:hypothetical protein